MRTHCSADTAPGPRVFLVQGDGDYWRRSMVATYRKLAAAYFAQSHGLVLPPVVAEVTPLPRSTARWRLRGNEVRFYWYTRSGRALRLEFVDRGVEWWYRGRLISRDLTRVPAEAVGHLVPLSGYPVNGQWLTWEDGL